MKNNSNTSPVINLTHLRNLSITLLLVIFSLVAQAQVSIGSIAPDASAQLDVVSTEKGILIPRMTEDDRDDISSPAKGLLIYQTDGASGFYYYDGSTWLPFISNSGAIIPYASGLPITVTTLIGGSVGLPSLVGFGSSVPLAITLGSTIDLTGAGGTFLNFAYSVPRDGTITSISAFFSNTAVVNLTGDATITAQLYSAPSGSNIFSPINSALVSLPLLAGSIIIGSTTAGEANVNIPVTAGSRLLLVFSVARGGFLPTTLAGYASAGVSIR